MIQCNGGGIELFSAKTSAQSWHTRLEAGLMVESAEDGSRRGPRVTREAMASHRGRERLHPLRTRRLAAPDVSSVDYLKVWQATVCFAMKSQSYETPSPGP